MESDYISREAAIAAVQPKNAPAINKVLEMMLNSVPAADVVEVVRCGECVRAVPSSNDLPMSFCRLHRSHHANDFFCANGKRRADDG